MEWFDVQIFVFFGEDIHTLLNYLITYVLTMSASSYCTDVVYKAYLLERTSVLETHTDFPSFIAFLVNIDNFFSLKIHIDIRLKRFDTLNLFAVQVNVD